MEKTCLGKCCKDAIDATKDNTKRRLNIYPSENQMQNPGNRNKPPAIENEYQFNSRSTWLYETRKIQIVDPGLVSDY